MFNFHNLDFYLIGAVVSPGNKLNNMKSFGEKSLKSAGKMIGIEAQHVQYVFMSSCYENISH